MKSPQLKPNRNTHYELRFHSLAAEGTGYAFPCDAGGRVNMDTLTDRARNNYLYARRRRISIFNTGSAACNRRVALPGAQRS
jgi:hypothetical protein